AAGNAIVGSGARNDNIQIRFGVDRSRLGANENLLVVIEYAAANVRRASSDPTACYNATLRLFDPTRAGCADQSWQLFLKADLNDIVFPFLTLIPPVLSHVDVDQHRGGANV